MEQQETTRTAHDDDWQRTQAVEWVLREIHNEAVAKYMAEPTEDMHRDIMEALMCALDDIQALSLTADANCWYPWCPDGRDRCVPCETLDDDGEFDDGDGTDDEN